MGSVQPRTASTHTPGSEAAGAKLDAELSWQPTWRQMPGTLAAGRWLEAVLSMQPGRLTGQEPSLYVAHDLYPGLSRRVQPPMMQPPESMTAEDLKLRARLQVQPCGGGGGNEGGEGGGCDGDCGGDGGGCDGGASSGGRGTGGGEGGGGDAGGGEGGCGGRAGGASMMVSLTEGIR